MQEATMKMALLLWHLHMHDRIPEPFPVQGTVLYAEGGKAKGMHHLCPCGVNARLEWQQLWFIFTLSLTTAFAVSEGRQKTIQGPILPSLTSQAKSEPST